MDQEASQFIHLIFVDYYSLIFWANLQNHWLKKTNIKTKTKNVSHMKTRIQASQQIRCHYQKTYIAIFF